MFETSFRSMEQNQVSDEELLERINKVVHESKENKKRQVAEFRQEDIFSEKFHDVYETTEQEEFNNNHNKYSNNKNNNEKNYNSGEVNEFGAQKNLVLENHYLSLQLQAEKRKAKELQTKFKLFENSVKYFERLNGQLENIKRAVDEDFVNPDKEEYNLETMQKIRPKTVHTTVGGLAGSQNNTNNFNESSLEDHADKVRQLEEKEEVTFKDAEDFKLLEQGLEIVKDKKQGYDSDAEKVFITKTEKRCLEDIGNLAARTRTPLDDKHQRFFEKERRKFAHSIIMPDVQEVNQSQMVPPEIISKTNETPVNITSTELDGLRSYLLQLKELIARRETAWARTTERDYNQRVEITRFKTEVGRLRILCEKRQRDIKERDQLLASKDEEIKELQKRIQGLRNALMKLEKKDDRLMDTIDGMTNEVLENSQIVQRSYNAMKRQSMINRANATNQFNVKPCSVIQMKPSSRSKDSIPKKSKSSLEKNSKRGKSNEVIANEEEWKAMMEKSKQKGLAREKVKSRHKNEVLVNKTKETYEKVDEKLQRVEEMLHNEVLKEARKSLQSGRLSKNTMDIKSFVKNQILEKNSADLTLCSKKLTPSNSTIRQEMLTAMTGLNSNTALGIRNPGFPDPKKSQQTATVIANALLAARNASVFNY